MVWSGIARSAWASAGYLVQKSSWLREPRCTRPPVLRASARKPSSLYACKSWVYNAELWGYVAQPLHWTAARADGHTRLVSTLSFASANGVSWELIYNFLAFRPICGVCGSVR